MSNHPVEQGEEWRQAGEGQVLEKESGEKPIEEEATKPNAVHWIAWGIVSVLAILACFGIVFCIVMIFYFGLGFGLGGAEQNADVDYVFLRWMLFWSFAYLFVVWSAYTLGRYDAGE